jgi:hypothetical protein
MTAIATTVAALPVALLVVLGESRIIAVEHPGLLVTCPSCGAAPWKPCRTSSGRPRLHMHAERNRTAPRGRHLLR